MKNLLYKSFLILLCVCLVVTAAGCSKKGSDETETEFRFEDLDTGIELTSLGDVQGFELVAQNSKFQLLLNRESSTVAVLNKANGQIWKSNLEEDEASKIANEDVQNEYRSQILVSYYNASQNKVTYNSYQYAVMESDEYNPCVWYYGKEDGLRIVYKIGKSTDWFYMPDILTSEDFEMLTSKMSEEDAEEFSFYYDELIYDEVDPELLDSYKLQYTEFGKGDVYYHLATSSRMTKSQCYQDFLQEVGVDMDMIASFYEHAGYSYQVPDEPQFTIPLDYTLTDTGFNVEIDMENVNYDTHAFRLYSMQLLPFFGAVADGRDADMLIPDGCGALINTKTDTFASVGLPCYGADNSIWTGDIAQNMQQATIPAYGLTDGKNAFMAYISEGDAIATIECHPKNKVYSVPYVGPSFTTHPFETFRSDGAAAKSVMQKYASDAYSGKMKINYFLMNGENLDYVDMAGVIRDYLFKGKEKLTDDSLRFYLECYGELLRKENFLGYAYNKKRALTTAEQVQEIYGKLNEAGIKNIAVRYNNWYGDAYVNKLSSIGKAAGTIGGTSAMQDLVSFVKEKGGLIYPNAELVLEKYSTSLTNATWHSKFIDGTMIGYSSNTLFSEGVTADFDRLVVKGESIIDKLPGIQKRLNKYEAGAVSLTTVGDTLLSDWTEDEVKYRDGVRDDMKTVLKTLKEDGNKIMVEKGNAYALPYTDDVLGVSLSDSSLSFEKAEVPFLQIVLHGYVSYAGNALNLADNYQNELLKSVEYGSNVYFVLNSAKAEMVKDTNYTQLYSTNFDHWGKTAMEDYARVAKVLDGCQADIITDHKALAKDVYCTTYESGKSVVVNYSAKPFTYKGKTVPASDFAVTD